MRAHARWRTRVMTRKTALEKQIEEVGRRPIHAPDALHNILLLECLEDMQAERQAKKKRRQPRRASGSIGVCGIEDEKQSSSDESAS